MDLYNQKINKVIQKNIQLCVNLKEKTIRIILEVFWKRCIVWIKRIRRYWYLHRGNASVENKRHNYSKLVLMSIHAVVIATKRSL